MASPGKTWEKGFFTRATASNRSKSMFATVRSGSEGGGVREFYVMDEFGTAVMTVT